MNKQDEGIEMEFRIWNYLDGSCDEAERNAIAILIAKDPDWQKSFAELSHLHQGLKTNLELEQPGMRFTQNVMEAVAGEKILKPASKYINHWVISVIAAFFIITILYFSQNLLADVNWQAGRDSLSGAANWIEGISVRGSALLYGTLFGTVVAGLILVDMLIKKKQLTDLGQG